MPKWSIHGQSVSGEGKNKVRSIFLIAIAVGLRYICLLRLPLAIDLKMLIILAWMKREHIPCGWGAPCLLASPIYSSSQLPLIGRRRGQFGDSATWRLMESGFRPSVPDSSWGSRSVTERALSHPNRSDLSHCCIVSSRRPVTPPTHTPTPPLTVGLSLHYPALPQGTNCVSQLRPHQSLPCP